MRYEVLSLLQGSFAKETYNCKEPDNHRHPISVCIGIRYVGVCIGIRYVGVEYVGLPHCCPCRRVF